MNKMNNRKMCCPKCGSTRFRVISLDLVRQDYDTASGEWSQSDCLADTYIVEVSCAECGMKLVPEVVVGYPTTKHLVRDFVQVVKWWWFTRSRRKAGCCWEWMGILRWLTSALPMQGATR